MPTSISLKVEMNDHCQPDSNKSSAPHRLRFMVHKRQVRTASCKPTHESGTDNSHLSKSGIRAERLTSALSAARILTVRPTCVCSVIQSRRQPIKQLVHGAIDAVEAARVGKHRLRRLNVAAFDDLVGAVGDDLLRTGRRHLQMKLQADDPLVVNEGLICTAGAARGVHRTGCANQAFVYD